MRYALLALVLASCGKVPEPPARARKVVAEVEGEPIYLDTYAAAYRNTTEDGELAASAGSQISAVVKQRFLDDLIDRRLLLHESERRGLSVTGEEIERAYRSVRNDYAEADFKEMLVQRGSTPDGFREELLARLLVEKLLGEEVVARLAVTEAEALDYYNAHLDEFRQPAQVRAQHIVVKTEEQAVQIRDEINKKKVAFEDLARAQSLSPEGAAGGDLGFFARGVMPAVFDDICFALKPGKMSDVVPSEYGYHLFKVNDLTPERQRSYEEVRETIRGKLRRAKQQEGETQFLLRLRKNATVKKYLHLLEEVH